jgi:hypothetical protein
MDGYRCWKLHRGVVLHLTVEKYCIIESRAQSKHTTIERYMNCREKYVFENVARHIDTPNKALNLFISNIIYTGNDQIFDSMRCWDNYARWIKEKESLTQLIIDDLVGFDLSDLQGYPSKLLSGVISGKVLPQTCTALNRIIPFLDRWIHEDHFTFGRRCVMMKKLEPFVKCNMDKIKSNLIEDGLLLSDCSV